MIAVSHYASPVGDITYACTDSHLVGLWLANQKYFAATLKETPVTDDHHPILLQTKDWLDRYFAGEKTSPQDLPLAPNGSDFRKAVWRILCEIPYGETVTYGDIAKQIAQQRGTPRFSAQAVGGAVGHNPISIIIPCHRVIGSNSSLTGYAGGIDAKRWLLSFECP